MRWGIQNKLCTTFIICTDVTFPLTLKFKAEHFRGTDLFFANTIESPFIIKTVFPWSLLGKMLGYSQLISAEISVTISWEYPQNVLSEYHRKHCFENERTLVGRHESSGFINRKDTIKVSNECRILRSSFLFL